MWLCIKLTCCAVFPQNGREDSLLTNALMTPPRSSTFLDTSLHKDVFGVISGTCELKNYAEKMMGKKQLFFLFINKKTFVCLFLQLRLTLRQPPTLTLCVTQTLVAHSSALTLATVCLKRTMTRATLWTRYSCKMPVKSFHITIMRNQN